MLGQGLLLGFKAVCLYVKLDLKEVSSSLGFAATSTKDYPCACCLCDRSDWDDISELSVLEHELGILNSVVRLKPAIKTLRKHKHALTLPARLALHAQVKPSRRVIKKTHAEDTH